MPHQELECVGQCVYTFSTANTQISLCCLIQVQCIIITITALFGVCYTVLPHLHACSFSFGNLQLVEPFYLSVLLFSDRCACSIFTTPFKPGCAHQKASRNLQYYNRLASAVCTQKINLQTLSHNYQNVYTIMLHVILYTICSMYIICLILRHMAR